MLVGEHMSEREIFILFPPSVNNCSKITPLFPVYSISAQIVGMWVCLFAYSPRMVKPFCPEINNSYALK